MMPLLEVAEGDSVGRTNVRQVHSHPGTTFQEQHLFPESISHGHCLLSRLQVLAARPPGRVRPTSL